MNIIHKKWSSKCLHYLVVHSLGKRVVSPPRSCLFPVKSAGSSHTWHTSIGRLDTSLALTPWSWARAATRPLTSTPQQFTRHTSTKYMSSTSLARTPWSWARAATRPLTSTPQQFTSHTSTNICPQLA
jgi:hypothetical protein